jgi:hypothetical protein
MHRLVDAAVAVLQLVGAEAERAAEELVAEADAEVGQALLQRRLEQLDLAGRRGRVTRAVGEEQTVRIDRVDVVERRGRGQHVHLDAALGHHPRGVRLDAEVDGGDREQLLAHGGDDVGLLRGDRRSRLAPVISPDSSTRASSASGSVSVVEMPTRIAPRSRR